MRPILFAFLLLGGCGNGCSKSTPPAATPATATSSSGSGSVSAASTASAAAGATDVTARGKAVLAALKAKDGAALAKLVHPKKGVRFSPYGFVETDGGVVVQADQLPAALTDPKKLVFGSYDGSGQPIELSLGEYWAEFVWDVDFTAGKLVLDPKDAHGNTVPNHKEVWPGSQTVELFLDGAEPENDGMDWRALRLVFETHEGALYLVGIVHDQWTI